MDESGSRSKEIYLNESFIIESKKVWWREALVLTFTILVWIYCILVIYYFMGALLGFNNYLPKLLERLYFMDNQNIQLFFLAVFLLFLGIELSLFLWGYYNKKKFGQLTRREQPPMASKSDLLGLGYIDEDMYETLQQAQNIILQTNPIRLKKNSENPTAHTPTTIDI